MTGDIVITSGEGSRWKIKILVGQRRQNLVFPKCPLGPHTATAFEGCTSSRHPLPRTGAGRGCQLPGACPLLSAHEQQYCCSGSCSPWAAFPRPLCLAIFLRPTFTHPTYRDPLHPLRWKWFCSSEVPEQVMGWGRSWVGVSRDVSWWLLKNTVSWSSLRGCDSVCLGKGRRWAVLGPPSYRLSSWFQWKVTLRNQHPRDLVHQIFSTCPCAKYPVWCPFFPEMIALF